jgi:hypothetical protein
MSFGVEAAVFAQTRRFVKARPFFKIEEVPYASVGLRGNVP